ncbi:hypothetical protein K402DRAFT_59092 [Aulographum hederae CBS 113979]|uniref:Uncharacterized protein n=1 Tax=Aulographum hederae CBS 113979 TaxID=1176131 RepID=A0A6G1GWZ3_9PEZI|nr:hypothetical protein K402DRAFT_106792 [Aulographum hederae CBS 113979]KAF1987368.1 hypothetical protein K402DRAFT_59092 [Aulographum hederae CBS 113979]
MSTQAHQSGQRNPEQRGIGHDQMGPRPFCHGSGHVMWSRDIWDTCAWHLHIWRCLYSAGRDRALPFIDRLLPLFYALEHSDSLPNSRGPPPICTQQRSIRNDGRIQRPTSPGSPAVDRRAASTRAAPSGP